jgi:hypothetical protein
MPTTEVRMPITPSGDAIELRVDDVAQLFQTLDPFPFREKDLDRDAEDYIVGWARELPAKQPITIVIHFPDTAPQAVAAQELSAAFTRYFSGRADAVQRDLNEMFRVGRFSLAIGIAILIACFGAAHLLAGRLFSPQLRPLVEESLLILGWVANWRPLEIFLYDWWPLTRRRRLYRRLASASVRIKPYANHESAAGT